MIAPRKKLGWCPAAKEPPSDWSDWQRHLVIAAAAKDKGHCTTRWLFCWLLCDVTIFEKLD
jgi:hypothetical protein